MNYKLPSEKMKNVSFDGGIREILAQADEMQRAGKDILHMEIGRPDFDSPECAKKAAIEALNRGDVHYTDMAGTFELRNEVALKFKRDSGMDVDPNREIVITAGAVEALSTVFMTILNPGDEVIVPSPYFPVYDDHIKMAGGVLRSVPCRIENSFRPSPDDIEKAINPKTRMIMINSPNNPTGATSTRAELEAIAGLAKSRDLLVLSDECYEKFAYDESVPHISIASLPGMKERTLTISAASKTFSMTGWRVGWLVIPSEMRIFIMKCHQGLATCANSFAQAGVAAALRSAWPDVDRMISEYKTRRDLMVDMLRSIDGIDVPTPGGAFYAFPSIKALGMSSPEFCGRLLSETGVSTVPGQPFGAEDGYMRLTYCRPAGEIKEALTRMGDFVSRLER
ncbi:MAG: pyridoxal phosphate-dependent aminotransferase [Synergistaceae bacterium]|jgi:aspartate aminotransferase/aminotransferase|nr:pyridoxal phosphate-dependent aminotransferase [Synergistaceae bacterium]